MHFDLEDVPSVRAWVAERPAAHAALLGALVQLPLFRRWRDVPLAALGPVADVPRETREGTPP